MCISYVHAFVFSNKSIGEILIIIHVLMKCILHNKYENYECIGMLGQLTGNGCFYIMLYCMYMYVNV